MDGYLVTFFTQRNRKYQGVSLAKWLVGKAKEMGIRGGTLIPGKEGFGHDGRFHSESLFDYEDSPQQVVMVMTCDEYIRLKACIEENNVRVFYVKTKAEFGYTSEK